MQVRETSEMVRYENAMQDLYSGGVPCPQSQFVVFVRLSVEGVEGVIPEESEFLCFSLGLLDVSYPLAGE
jgi:hypothetical protein